MEHERRRGGKQVKKREREWRRRRLKGSGRAGEEKDEGVCKAGGRFEGKGEG